MSENPRPFVPSWLDDFGLSQAEFRIYCHLCRRADNQTGIAWPSYASMIEVCGAGKTTIRRCLDRLASVEVGLITKVGKPFGGSCRYKILTAIVPSGGQLSGANSSATGTIEGTPIVPPQDCNSSTRGTPIVPPQDSNSSARGTGRVSKEGHPIKVIQLRTSKLPFASDKFSEAWDEWNQHRREKKKPITPTSRTRQFKQLEAMGEPRAIAAIHHSIAQGWTGIFEPTANANQPKTRELSANDCCI